MSLLHICFQRLISIKAAPIDQDELYYLQLCELVEDASISRDSFDRLRKIMFEHTNISMPCVRRRGQRLERMSGVRPRLIDCCINSCMAFTGPDADRTNCSYCEHPRRQQSAYNNEKWQPYQQFVYIPLTDRLRQQFASFKRANTLQRYHLKFFNLDFTPEQLIDWWSGKRYRELRAAGYFTQITDIALQILLDGVQLTEKKPYNTTPVILINLNLPPAVRYQKQNILLSLIIPGPKKHKNIDSYLHPLVEELNLLGKGVDAYNAAKQNEHFTLQAWPVIVTGTSALTHHNIANFFR